MLLYKLLKVIHTNISKYQYENIKVFDELPKVFGDKDGITKDDDAKVDSKSFYLKFSLIILILLF